MIIRILEVGTQGSAEGVLYREQDFMQSHDIIDDLRAPFSRMATEMQLGLDLESGVRLEVLDDGYNSVGHITRGPTYGEQVPERWEAPSGSRLELENVLLDMKHLVRQRGGN